MEHGTSYGIFATNLKVMLKITLLSEDQSRYLQSWELVKILMDKIPLLYFSSRNENIQNCLCLLCIFCFKLLNSYSACQVCWLQHQVFSKISVPGYTLCTDLFLRRIQKLIHIHHTCKSFVIHLHIRAFSIRILAARILMENITILS